MMEKVSWYLKGKRHIGVSSSLMLQDNGTFNFSTCGCSSKGNWVQKTDTLYLAETIAEFKFANQTGTAEATAKKCLKSNYRIDKERLFRITYDEGDWIECLKPEQN
ncbi:hypothetical protein [Adhaeribacter soli]|uniref:Uncharacterized protein n=1 Tax=Adhaeribacter soli TaxID=2607655 RepID=A0A5N1J2N2_9BACT|nr:hypothetical protein [Adhaeribacter soli]KAA9340026.1 hypothetical protein F0P94_06665 [Adhaeribacter soli]